jgi:serine/threonine-protein kinase
LLTDGDSAYHRPRVNGFTAVHLGIASVCALLAALHVAMSLAVRSEPAHRWVATCFVGFTLLDLGLAGSSVASEGSLGDPHPWLLLTVPTVLLLPAALVRTAYAVLDWPMTPRRHAVVAATFVLVLPVAIQFTYFVLTDAPQAASWEQARYANLWTAAPYNAAIVLIAAVWVIEAIRALPSMRATAITALVVVIPSMLLGIREAFVATDVVHGPTLVGITALPLGAFASASLVIRYVRALSRTDDSPVSTEHYDRMAKLGAGGMGELWLALRSGEAGFRRWVVVKRIRMDRIDEHLVDRFLIEARIAARLHHANIVSVYDLGHYDDGWFIVMEYLSGPSLWEVMTRCYEEEEFAPISAVAQIGVDICRGLECAHIHGILHRDISPDNIILTFDGIAKLLDFGIAKEAEAERAMTGSMPGELGTSSRETAAGGIVGKAQYLAPERAMGDPATVQSDVFAVGLVMVQLMGAPIPERGSDLAGHPAPVSEYRPDTPPEMERIICKALASHPRQRYESAAEMANDLMALTAHGGPVNLSQWTRDLCPGRWTLARRLDELRKPTPDVVADLFADLMDRQGEMDTEGSKRVPVPPTANDSGKDTQPDGPVKKRARPPAPTTVRVGRAENHSAPS